MRLIYLVIIILFSKLSEAQYNDSAKLLKIGIYKTAAELQKGKPSITKAFAIDTQYHLNNSTDSIITGYKYHFTDSSPIVMNAFGLFDGSSFYIIHKKGSLEKMTQAGKYPYKVYKAVKDEVALGDVIDAVLLPTGAVGLLDKMVSGPKDVIVYYNRKGKPILATAQSIGFLLRSEKDLLKEYEKEKQYNCEVYIKYLSVMNERYPL